MRELAYENYDPRYQVLLYLWWVEPILKRCKIPKYYVLDCRYSYWWWTRFDYQVSQICKKARKNYTSSKLCKVMDQNKQRILMKWFTILRLPYCLLVWILPSRNTKNRTNKIFERALKLVYDDSPYLSFDELQIKTNRLASIKDLICFWQLQSFMRCLLDLQKTFFSL